MSDEANPKQTILPPHLQAVIRQVRAALDQAKQNYDRAAALGVDKRLDEIRATLQSLIEHFQNGWLTVQTPLDARRHNRQTRDLLARFERLACAPLHPQSQIFLLRKKGNAYTTDPAALEIAKAALALFASPDWPAFYRLPAAVPAEKQPRQKRKITKDLVAARHLAQNPALTDAQIAALVGCSRQNLRKLPTYQKIKRQLRDELNNRRPPRGFKIAGFIEAVDADDE